MRIAPAMSMASEEIGLNEALEADGVEVVETDLGEFICQVAGEPPSHILAPAIHRDRSGVAEVLSKDAGRVLEPEPEALATYARERLRDVFFRADIGVTGVNFGVAESGTLVLVTNEGNGRMVTSLPPVHVAIMGLERIVGTWEELDVLLALLPRSATGQALTVYTTFTSGPRQDGEIDGSEEMHVVILDNGRSQVLGTRAREILHCIRCGACLNVCPVYRQIGGHAYGSVYGGPVGAVLTTLLFTEQAEHAGA
jgi:L-lactate dehydrogenase complex protein LldF